MAGWKWPGVSDGWDRSGDGWDEEVVMLRRDKMEMMGGTRPTHATPPPSP